MASHAHNYPGSAAQTMELCDLDATITFGEACQAVKPLKMDREPVPLVVHKTKGKLTVSELPLFESVGSDKEKIVQFFDVILAQEKLSKQDLQEFGFDGICKSGVYKNLPAPLKPKREPLVPYTMQIFIVPGEEEGKYTVVKHVMLQPSKLSTNNCKSLCFGQCMQLDYGHNYRDGSAAAQFMLEHLGGTQVRYNFLIPKGQKKPKGHPDREARRAGYAFIRKEGPKANKTNEFVEWTDEKINDPTCRIYGWSAAEVKESLSNYAKGRQGAKTLDKWAVTLRDYVYPQIMKYVAQIIAQNDRFGATIGGESRVGKSTLCKTIGMDISEYHIQKGGRSDLVPNIVTTKVMDHLRLEPGTKEKPAMMEDVRMQSMSTEEVKAAADTGEEDAALWARWGGIFFEMNQWRCFSINPYDKDFEKTMKSCNLIREEVSMSDFKRMIEVNWPKASTDADVGAYLNRMFVLWFSEDWIYFHAPLRAATTVERIPWPNAKHKDIFVPEVRTILSKYKKDQNFKPDGFEDKKAWDIELVARLMDGQELPEIITVESQDPDSAGVKTEFLYGEFVGPSPLEAFVAGSVQHASDAGERPVAVGSVDDFGGAAPSAAPPAQASASGAASAPSVASASSGASAGSGGEEERRIDPTCQGRAVTYGEMVREHVDFDPSITDDQLAAHWAALKPADQAALKPKAVALAEVLKGRAGDASDADGSLTAGRVMQSRKQTLTKDDVTSSAPSGDPKWQKAPARQTGNPGVVIKREPEAAFAAFKVQLQATGLLCIELDSPSPTPRLKRKSGAAEGEHTPKRANTMTPLDLDSPSPKASAIVVRDADCATPTHAEGPAAEDGSQAVVSDYDLERDLEKLMDEGMEDLKAETCADHP